MSVEMAARAVSKVSATTSLARTFSQTTARRRPVRRSSGSSARTVDIGVADIGGDQWVPAPRQGEATRLWANRVPEGGPGSPLQPRPDAHRLWPRPIRQPDRSAVAFARGVVPRFGPAKYQIVAQRD